MPGVGVQQFPLVRLAQQGLMRMLTVDIDEQRPQRRAVLQGGDGAIDIGPAAPFGGNNAAQQELFADVEIALAQPRLGCGNVGYSEGHADFGALAAGAHGRGVGAITEAQAQRVEHDGFPGSCFAGDYGHALREIHLELCHDGVVANVNLGEHVRSRENSASYTPLAARNKQPLRSPAQFVFTLRCDTNRLV